MDQTTQTFNEEKGSIPLSIIRTETALSRFPFHRLAKKGLVQIEIKNQASALLWEVTYNSKYGQPGPLAYKLDTLVINRRIEEKGRPVAPVIKLGSLAQIAAELGLNRDTNSVKTALLQNAFAAVNAKISYRAVDKTERTLEAAFTRYAVVFTGEKLPSGAVADAVHLVLHPIYAEVLNAAVTRPLDYDYMKTLPPAAQRFYEVVSYQIYAAIHFQNERARLRYSDYCLLSTATRYFDFDHVKKQMYKVHKPHLDSGYLVKVGYEETTDSVGQPDWWMYYVPGPNASREYQQFTGVVRRPSRRGNNSGSKTPPANGAPVSDGLLISLEQAAQTSSAQSVLSSPSNATLETRMPLADTADTPTALLIEQLVAAGLNRKDAKRFAGERPDECRRQLEYLPYKTDLKKPGGWLNSAIEGEFGPPDEYLAAKTKEESARKKQEEAQQKKVQQTAQEARRREETARVDAAMAQLQKDAPEAFSAFLANVADERRKAESKYASMPPAVLKRTLQLFDSPDEQRKRFHDWQKHLEEEPAEIPTSALRSPATTFNVPPVAPVDPAQNPSTSEEDPETVRALLRASLEEASSKPVNNKL